MNPESLEGHLELPQVTGRTPGSLIMRGTWCKMRVNLLAGHWHQESVLHTQKSQEELTSGLEQKTPQH